MDEDFVLIIAPLKEYLKRLEKCKCEKWAWVEKKNILSFKSIHLYTPLVGIIDELEKAYPDFPSKTLYSTQSIVYVRLINETVAILESIYRKRYFHLRKRDPFLPKYKYILTSPQRDYIEHLVKKCSLNSRNHLILKSIIVRS